MSAKNKLRKKLLPLITAASLSWSLIPVCPATATGGADGGDWGEWWDTLDVASVQSKLAQNIVSGTALNVKEAPYGATGNGTDLDTTAIQSAIDAAQEGDEIYFPSGIYKTQGLVLKSNITLNLAKGAVIKASSVSADWTDYNEKPLIGGWDIDNILIKGEGTLDGSAPAYHKPAPDGGRIDGPKPQNLIYMENCSNVTVKGITLMDTVSWTSHYNNCDYVFIDGITIRNPELEALRNGDGIDINGCRNVIIQNCDIEASDDAVCLKNIGMGAERPNDRAAMYNILVQDCRLASTCNATKIGTETVGDVYNVVFQRITVYKHTRSDDPVISAICFQSNDGALVYNITARDYLIEDVDTPIFLELQDRGRGPAKPLGQLRDILIENVNCLKSYRASQINTAEGAYLGDVTLKNISIHNFEQLNTREPLKHPDAPGGAGMQGASAEGTYPEPSFFGRMPAYGLYARNVDSLSFEGEVKFFDRTGSGRPMLVFDDTDIDAQYTSDLVLAEEARDAFELENVNAVTSDLTLPTQAPNGAKITWTSSSENILTASGKINRPKFEKSNATVLLTALFSENSASASKEFYVKVLSTRYPDADTFLNAAQSTEINGSADGLIVNGETKQAYLRFDLRQINESVQNVKLRVKQTDGIALEPESLSLYPVSNDDWQETVVNSDNGAALSQSSGAEAIAIGVPSKTHTAYDFDVTEYFEQEKSGDGFLSLKLVSSATRDVTFASKEAEIALPELVITTAELEPVNMLTNPGFEQGMEGDWRANDNSSNKRYYLTDEDSYTGSYSLKLDGKAEKTNTWFDRDPSKPGGNIALTTNTKYLFSFYYKMVYNGTAPVETLDPGNFAYVSLRAPNPAGGEINLVTIIENSAESRNNGAIYKNVFVPDGKWHQITCMFNSGDNEKLLFKGVRDNNSIEGMTYYFDDFLLRPIEEGEIFNGGFEDGLHPWFLEYTTNTQNTVAEFDTSVAHSGYGSLKVTGGGGDWWAVYHPFIRLSPGKNYRLSFYYKYEGGEGPRVYLYDASSRWYGTGTAFVTDMLTGGSDEWHYYDRVFNSGALTDMVIRLRDAAPAGVVCYYDDIVLEELSDIETEVSFEARNLPEGKELTAAVEAANYSGLSANLKVFAVEYSNTGRVTNLGSSDVTLADGGTLTVPVRLHLSNNISGNHVKVYIWKDGATMYPARVQPVRWN